MLQRGRHRSQTLQINQDIPVFSLGVLFFLGFLMIPILVPESNTGLASSLRFSAATFFGKSVTDLTQDIIGFQAMLAHENAYPILYGLRSTHMPTTFLFVAPVALLPWMYATMAWAFLMLLGMFWTLRLIGCSWPRAIGLGCLTILWAPMMHSFGQFTILWLLLATLAYTMRNRRTVASGIFIGLATLMKVLPAVLLIPFLLHRQWKALYGFLVATALGVATAFLLSPETIYLYLSLRENIQTTILRKDNSSLFNVGYQLFGLPGLALAVFLLTAFLWANHIKLGFQDAEIEEKSWMVWSFLSVILLPVVWIYSLVPLLPIVLHLLVSRKTIVKFIGLASLILPICGPAWGFGAVPFVAGTTLLLGVGITIAGDT